VLNCTLARLETKVYGFSKLRVQNLKRKSKTRKVEEGNILSPMATPKGYGTIYWERAAGLKKTKLHMTESGESKTNNSHSLKKSNEPKVWYVKLKTHHNDTTIYN
jgi:hypothetical protein